MTAQEFKKFIAMQKLHKQQKNEGMAVPGDPLSNFDKMQAQKVNQPSSKQPNANNLIAQEQALEKTTPKKTAKELELEKQISNMTGKKYIGSR